MHGRGHGMADLRRRRGRPHVAPGEQTVPLTVLMGTSLFDRLSTYAITRGVSLPQAVRELLDGELTHRKIGNGRESAVA